MGFELIPIIDNTQRSYVDHSLKCYLFLFCLCSQMLHYIWVPQNMFQIDSTEDPNLHELSHPAELT